MLHEFFQRGISALKDGVRATLTPYRLRKVRPGIDTRDKVRQQLGSATMTWSDQRGDTWEYACTPFGTQNYMIDFAPNGVVLRIRPTLTEPHFARILVGMDKEDVRRMLGKLRRNRLETPTSTFISISTIWYTRPVAASSPEASQRPCFGLTIKGLARKFRVLSGTAFRRGADLKFSLRAHQKSG